MIGQTVQHYLVTAKLGEGGMGEVYLATDTKLGRKVALKFLPRDFATDPERRKRLELEATSASSLDHPNILTIYEINEHDGHPFIAMAYVEGMTLRDKLVAGALPLPQVMRYGVQLASALGASHARGIIHRDLKPDNVLIGADDRARLTDFGLAKLKESSGLTNRGATVGTVGYMSPEQAQGMTVDARSDVFSLGVMLYQMLAGKLPFAAEHAAAALYSIVHENPPPLREVASDVPAELTAIVERALAKKPEDRYPDGAAMEQELRAVARTLEFSHISSGRIPVSRPSRRLRVVWAVTGVLAIVAGLVLALGPRQSRSPGGSDARAQENTLAVLNFENLSDPNDTARVGDIITELLTTDLSGSQYVKVVSSQRLYDLAKQEKVDASRGIGREQATQIARKAGATRMLTGALSKLGGQSIVTAQLSDVASGDVIGSERVDGTDLYAMVDELSLRIKRRIGLSETQAQAGDMPVAEVTSANPAAFREYLRGMDYYHALDWDNAHRHFDQALAVDSTFALAYLRKGIAYMSDGQREKALAMFAAAGRHIDRVTGCDRLLLEVFTNDLQRWDVDDATRDLKRGTIECPTDKEMFFWVANLAFSMNQLDTAVAYSRRALDLDPEYPFALFTLGGALIKQRNFAAARPIVTRYVSLRPQDFVPYELLASIFLHEQRYDSALATYYRALQATPGQRYAYMGVAQVHLLMGHADSAIAWCERTEAIDENPYTTILVWRYIGAIQKSQGRFDAAMQSLRQARDAAATAGLKDQVAVVETFIGTLLWDADRPAEALGHYEQAGWLDTLSPAGIARAAKVCAALGETPKMAALVDTLQRRWSGRIDSLLLRALEEEIAAKAAMAAGQYGLAIDHLLLARRLSNDSTGDRLPLAEAYIMAQKYDPAITELTALRRDAEADWPTGDYIRGLYFLALAYERSGRPNEAREPLERFLVFWGNPDWKVPLVDKAKQLYAGLSAQ
jgi:serine/threonine protein kinase/tetratricopeptide (TPR) repeat protein